MVYMKTPLRLRVRQWWRQEIRPLLILAVILFSIRIKLHAVGTTRRLHEGGELAIHAPLHNAVVRLVYKKNIPRLVARGAFGEFKATGKFLQRRTRCDDIL